MPNLPSPIRDLDRNILITNPDGTPTAFFMQFMQDRGIGQTEVEKLLKNKIIADGGLTLNGGTGYLADGDVHLSAQASAILDQLGTSRGAMLYRGASGWVIRAAGAANTVLTMGALDPAWSTLSALLDSISSTQGAILYRGASSWVALAPGTAGQVLTTGGTGANPSWATAAASGGTYIFNQTTSGSHQFKNNPAASAIIQPVTITIPASGVSQTFSFDLYYLTNSSGGSTPALSLVLDSTSFIAGSIRCQPLIDANYGFGFSGSVTMYAAIAGTGSSHTVGLGVAQFGGGSGFTVTTAIAQIIATKIA